MRIEKFRETFHKASYEAIKTCRTVSVKASIDSTCDGSRSRSVVKRFSCLVLVPPPSFERSQTSQRRELESYFYELARRTSAECPVLTAHATYNRLQAYGRTLYKMISIIIILRSTASVWRVSRLKPVGAARASNVSASSNPVIGFLIFGFRLLKYAFKMPINCQIIIDSCIVKIRIFSESINLNFK